MSVVKDTIVGDIMKDMEEGTLWKKYSNETRFMITLCTLINRKTKKMCIIHKLSY
ncbi:hypothetical protein JHK85_006166 [Glycine max]|nr:hypothetical protein JHK85_006166 [Glycine max]